MKNAYVVSGTLTDARTVRLDETLPLQGKVRLVIEPAEPAANGALNRQVTKPWDEWLAELRAAQEARGFVPADA